MAGDPSLSARYTAKNKGYFFAAPMRQMVVPQSGHLPFVIGLPFFVVLSTGSCIIFLALHFTQYASIAMAVKHLSCSLLVRADAHIRSREIRGESSEQ